MNYYWANAVLGYKGQQQFEVLEKMLGAVTPWRIAALLLAVGGLLFALRALNFFRWQGKKKLPAEVRIYLSMCGALQRAGYSRGESEAPITYARRLAALNPAWKHSLLAATRLYVAISYEPAAALTRQSQIKLLRSEVLKLRYQLRR
ncbi:MAG: DUF4129 domain-containing protein [Halieaceae bacterium]|nr:DUF4129 domain-containing protein [Halieaceae bacterium]